MSKTDIDATVEQPKKKKVRRLLLLIVAAFMLVGAGVSGYVMLSDPLRDSKPTGPEPGPVVTMDAVTVNLADGHYLKMRLALQTTKDASSDFNGAKALDLAISKYTDMPMEQLSSAAGRAKAKAELLDQIKKAYDGEVMDIYFMEFVMQ